MAEYTDFMIGERATCSSCGFEIEYVGPHWRHTTCSPRHIATPKERPPEQSDMEELLAACEAFTINVKEGDTVVLKTSRDITAVEAHTLQEVARQTWPLNKTVFVGPGMSLTVLPEGEKVS